MTEQELMGVDTMLPHQQRISRAEAEERAKAHEWKPPRPSKHPPKAVTQPPHYCHGEIECIDAIRAMLGDVGFTAFLRGQVARYDWRVLHKENPVQDAQKLEHFAKWLREHMERVEAKKAAQG